MAKRTGIIILPQDDDFRVEVGDEFYDPEVGTVVRVIEVTGAYVWALDDEHRPTHQVPAVRVTVENISA